MRGSAMGKFCERCDLQGTGQAAGPIKYAKPVLAVLTARSSSAHCGNGSGATYDHNCLAGGTIEAPNCGLGADTKSTCLSGTGAKISCVYGGAVSQPCFVGTHPTSGT